MLPVSNPRYHSNLHTYIAFLCAIPFTFYLIFLIRNFTPFILRPFKRILVLYIIVDSYLTLCGLLIHTDHIAIRTDSGVLYFVLISGFIQYPPKYITLVFAAFNQCAVYWTLSSVTSIFIYRYIYICRTHLLKRVSFVQIATTSIILPTLVFIKVIIEFWPQSDYPSYLKYFDNTDWVSDNSMPVYVVSTSASSAIPLLFGYCSVLVPFAISIICAILITRKLAEIKLIRNARKRRMQHDVTKILSIQLFLPFIGFGIPLFLRQCSMVFNVNLPTSVWFAYIVVWSPTINAIFIIAIIEPYKLKTIEYIKALFCRVPPTRWSTVKVTPMSGILIKVSDIKI